MQALFIALPTLVETIIQKHLAPKLPQGFVVSDLEFKIEKIGIRHTLVTHVNMGQDLSADFVELQYNFKDLKNFQLEKLIISGLKIHARVDADNQLLFNGETFPRKIKDAPKDTGDPNHFKADSFPGFIPKQVVLRKSNLSITTPDHKILVPFDLLASLDIQKNKAVLNARFHPFGQTVKTLISGDFYSGIEFVKLEARSFNPEVLTGLLSGILPETGKIRFSGPVDIDISKKLDTWQFSLSQLKLDYTNFSDEFSDGLSGGKIQSNAKIENFTALVGLQTGKIVARGGFDLSGSLVPAMGLVFDLKLFRKEDSPPSFDLTLKNRQVNEIILVHRSNRMNFKQPNFLFKLKGNLAHQTGDFLFNCKNFRATQGKETLFVENILLKSGIKGDFSEKGKGFDFDIQSDLSRIKLAANPDRASIEAVSLKGKAGFTKQFFPLVQLDARIKNGKIEIPKSKITATGINAIVPLDFPFKNGNSKGSFFVQEIGYDNKFKAGLKGNITQSKPLGLNIGGQLAIEDLDGFSLRFEGRAEGDQPYVKIDFFTDPFLLMPSQIKKIMPKLSLSADSFVQFSSKGTFEYKYHDIKTQASIMIDEGHLFFPDMNLTLSGIAGAINFNDLVVPESLPGQVLTIDKIRAGQFQFDKAKARFSIEDGESVNIENFRFNWCNGLVSTESIRLPAKDNLLSLILYCDRLELSSLLKQTGAFHAEGEGALSGRIPVVYSNGNISFDKGFLFSTPGQGGRVVIKNTEKITVGIPLDTPEFAQLDLAREALKDFDYTWAKLELNTFEDTLYVNMELDGKPAKLLPFEYQKDIGSFIRVDASSPGSRFQGIKMDVNLKLPFNQVLKFGNKINSILN